MNNRDADDEGITLVELIIYIVLIGLVGGLVVTLFINTWQTERTVNERTAATTRGQLISSQIEKAMRNGIGFEVAPDGSQLMVHTTLAGPLACQGFRFSTDGATQMIVSAAPVEPADDWPGWHEGVMNEGGLPYLAASGTSGIVYSFYATDPEATSLDDASVAVLFEGEAHMRNSTNQGAGPCS